MHRWFSLPIFALAVLPPGPGWCGPAYRFDIVTAYDSADPFLNRIDSAFVELDTGYLQIQNNGPSDFHGTIRTIAVSVFAGDLGFAIANASIPAGGSVSIAIPDDASNAGGFNGPAYYARSGVILELRGLAGTVPVDLAVADRDIHSGVFRTDPYGLATDSFVLQGGDPWGFDAGDAFELSQAWGHYAFLGPVAQAAAVPEPALGGLLSLALAAMLPVRALLWPRGRVRGNTRG